MAAAAAAPLCNKVKLLSSDYHVFEVEEAVAFQCVTIRNMIEDTGSHHAVPLPNVASITLVKVLEYCKFHSSARLGESHGPSPDDGSAFDAEYIKVDQYMLYDLLLAANYLNIKGLLDLTCNTVAKMISNRSPDEIRRIFNIGNDFTPDEEEAVRRENEWAFE